MAFRRPLYIEDNHLREMTDSQITDLRTMMYWKYLQDPSVTLSVVGSGGNLGTINDTRLIAGAYRTFKSRYPTEAELAEPSALNIGYQRISQFFEAAGEVPDTGNTAFPLYYTGDGNLRSMSLQDMYDTIVSSAIESITAGDDVYSIASSQTKSGYDILSTTPIFRDTGTDTSKYTAGGIPEVLDQPLADPLNEFYLFQRNPSGASYSFVSPIKFDNIADTSKQFNQYEDDALESLFQALVRHSARDVEGLQIRYSWNGSGNNSGSVTDKRLNGSGNRQVRFVNANDYRAQEFPNGSRVVAQTHVLRVRVE